MDISDAKIDEGSHRGESFKQNVYPIKLDQRESFLFKMMSDPIHKTILYFLEVLLNAETQISVEKLASRISNSAFSSEMRASCGGGSVETLTQFLKKYPALFSVSRTGQVTAVPIEIPGFDEMSEASIDIEQCLNFNEKSSNLSAQETAEKLPLSFGGEKESTTAAANNTLVLTKTSRLEKQEAEFAEIKPVGIYRPPNLRNQISNEWQRTSLCEVCPIDTMQQCPHLPNNVKSTIHCCPLAEVSLKHQFKELTSPLRHTHSMLCFCAPSVTDTQICHKIPCNHTITTPKKTDLLETEAVNYFRQKLLKRDERWVHIRSLAGHLSQASSEVRALVGPQLEFRAFLIKHSNVFEVQGDLVSLKDVLDMRFTSKNPRSFALKNNSYSTVNLSTTNNSKSGVQFFPRPTSMLMLPNISRHKDGHICMANRTLGNASSASDYHLSRNHIEQNMTDNSSAPISRPNTEALHVLSQGYQKRAIFASKPSTKQNFDNSNSSVWTNTISGDLKRKKSLETAEGITIRMNADEYRSVMFLRKVLDKNGGAPGQPGVPLTALLHILSDSTHESAQSGVCWTKVEMEEFILRHLIFFEVHSIPQQDNSTCELKDDAKLRYRLPNDCTESRVNNRRIVKMINIVITANPLTDLGSRTLTNRSGSVFHVAKLWGIIDLGEHEHVYFDKSILKYVDDLQKHFKVDEILYFNAIMAPKNSRAKWRATRVWKECDKEIMDKIQGSSFTGSDEGLIHRLKSNLETSSAGMNVADPDYEINLTDNEEVDTDEALISAIAQSEGLNLAKDIKFLSKEVEEEMRRLLSPTKSKVEEAGLKNEAAANCYSSSYGSDEGTSLTGCMDDISFTFSDVSRNAQSEKISSQACSKANSSTKQTDTGDLSSSETESSHTSIAVQTISTGDIMATQIFHELI